MNNASVSSSITWQEAATPRFLQGEIVLRFARPRWVDADLIHLAFLSICRLSDLEASYSESC